MSHTGMEGREGKGRGKLAFFVLSIHHVSLHPLYCAVCLIMDTASHGFSGAGGAGAEVGAWGGLSPVLRLRWHGKGLAE